MVDIKKKLLKQRDLRVAKETRENESALSEVKDLLQAEGTEDTSMLKYFGTSETLSKVKSKASELKSFEPNTQVTFEDVRTVCKRYALKCLPASQYQKSLPLSVLHNLRKFEAELPEHLQGNRRRFAYDEVPTGKLNKERLLVIAPKNHFKVNGTFKIQKDPVLLYITEGTVGRRTIDVSGPFATSEERVAAYVRQENSFEIIDKWGKDFTFLRRIKGLMQYSWTFNIAFFLVCFYSAFKGAYFMADHIGDGPLPVLFLGLCAIGYILYVCFTWKHKESWEMDA